jgi:hypothetical protein
MFVRQLVAVFALLRRVPDVQLIDPVRSIQITLHDGEQLGLFARLLTTSTDKQDSGFRF